jgi:hypothetical protein
MRSNVTSIADTAAWRRGVSLAIALLEELEAKQVEASLPDEDNDGRPQDEILLRCLHRARDAGPTVERAFAAVLSDVLCDHQSSLDALEECALSPTAMKGRVE